MAQLNFKEIIEKTPGLTDEQKKMATDLFGIESLTTLIEETSMHRANEAFAATKAEMQANWDRANTEYISMQEKVANHDATAAELTKAKADLAAATERLKTANPNIDIEKMTKDITEVVRNEARTLEMGRGAIELDALECADEHRQLFGSNLSVRQLVQDALAAKKSPKEYWEEHYKVTDKRNEVTKAAHDKEIADAVESGYKKRIAEEANPSTRPLTASRDPFWVPKETGKQDAINPWDEGAPPVEETTLMNELQASRGQ